MTLTPSLRTTQCDAQYGSYRLEERALASRKDDSEPIVSYASPIPWQVFEAVEPVEVVNGKLRHRLRFRQPKIDRDATLSVFARLLRSPIRDAATYLTEMKLNRRAPDVGSGRTRDSDAFTLKVVCPEHAVAATYRAIACRGGLGQPFEPPLHRTAVTGTSDHFTHPFDLVTNAGARAVPWFVLSLRRDMAPFIRE